jgi:hypothetical protein
MDSLESKEKKFTEIIEKIIMYFLYILFAGIAILIAWSGSFRESLIIVPIAAITIPLTKWSIKWQNERYIRSAKNLDDIETLFNKMKELEERLEKLERK